MKTYLLIIICVVCHSCQTFNKSTPFYAVNKKAGIVFIRGNFDQDTLSLKINETEVLDEEIFNRDKYMVNPDLMFELREDSVVKFDDMNFKSSFRYDLEKTIYFEVILNGKVFYQDFKFKKGKYFLISYERLESTVNKIPPKGIRVIQYKKPLYFE